jgi:hypothetical protein
LTNLHRSSVGIVVEREAPSGWRWTQARGTGCRHRRRRNHRRRRRRRSYDVRRRKSDIVRRRSDDVRRRKSGVVRREGRWRRRRNFVVLVRPIVGVVDVVNLDKYKQLNFNMCIVKNKLIKQIKFFSWSWYFNELKKYNGKIKISGLLFSNCNLIKKIY